MDAVGITNVQFINENTYNITSVLNNGYTKIAAPIVFSLIFTIPFVLVYYSQETVRKGIFSFVNIASSLMAAVISGNRMLLLLIMFTTLVCIFMIKKTKKNILFFFIAAGLVLIFLVRMSFFEGNISLYSLTERIINEIRFDDENVRWKQIMELFKGFLEKPIIGSGFAAGVSGIVRNEQDWLYEVVYMLYLYNTGIIGLIFYLALIVSVVFMAVKIKKINRNNKYILPALMGYICILLACWTNPVLGKFDSLWFLFLIPMYFNNQLLNRKRICV